MADSILGYIRRSRAGLVRSLLETTLQACGHQPAVLTSQEVSQLRGRLESAILQAASHPDLKEPTALPAPKPEPVPEPEPDVAVTAGDTENEKSGETELGTTPEGAVESDQTVDAELPGNPEIEVRQPPPPIKRRR